MDGIHITNEFVDGLKKVKKSGLVCKIDLEKAYNRVDCDFLQWVLHKKGFGEGLVGLWGVWITLTFLLC